MNKQPSSEFKTNFVTLPEFANLLGVQKTCFYNMFNAGKLPLPISIYARRKVWKRSIVEEFITTLI